MQKYSSLFFDLFNTLVNVGEVPESVGRFTADVLNVDQEQWNRVCFSDAHDITGPTEHEQIIRALARELDPNISDDAITQATEHRQRRFDHALKHVRSDVLDALQGLKQRGFTLCLISNASTAEVAAWNQSPLARLFDRAVFSCHCGFKKPDESIYHYALDQCQARPSQGVFIGDGGSDEFTGAHRSGLLTILTTQFSKQHRIEKVREQQGHAIADEIGHLNELLDRL